MWTKLFLEAQGYEIETEIGQDNESAIKLEKNGKKSSSKRTRVLNIRYFFIVDQIEKGDVAIVCCPTDELTGDYNTKPLQGAKFLKFKKRIMETK